MVKRDINGNEYNRNLLIMAMSIGSFVSILNQSILGTALPKLITYFAITASTAQWLTTSFMLVNAIMIPLTALLLEKFSTKNIFLVAMVTFGIGTIVCAISFSFRLLLIGRIIQAVGTGIIMPLISTVLLLIFPPEKRGTAMGLYGLVVCFAPAIGPSLAGIIVDKFNWQYLFYILIPIIVIDIIFSCLFIKDIIPLKNPKIDFQSILLSTVGFGTMLFGFSNAGNRGWLNTGVIISIIIGTVLVALFILRQISMKTPMLNLSVFKFKSFTITTIISSILTICSTGSGIILPIFLQNIVGKTAFASGLILLPASLAFAFTMMISGRLYDKYGVKILALSGIGLFVIFSIPLVNLHKDISVTLFAIILTLRNIGYGLVLTPIQTAGMDNLPDRLLVHASSSVNTAKQVTASLGSAVLITIMVNFQSLYAPGKSLAEKNAKLFNSEILNVELKSMNITFIIVLSLALISLVISFFLKDKERTRNSYLENDKINFE